MKMADFLARLRNRKWKMRKTVWNIADFRFFSVSLYENLDKLNAEKYVVLYRYFNCKKGKINEKLTKYIIYC
ncbi:hypothetical protein J2Q21_12405 [Tenacibaculum finnmarkense genomovar ulcerans]|uniref:hypothetical protein n=1 Tax=Tenacibaculum finnmarkense TaxID=2781243 RepID=UPI001EFB4F0A|nr:hypothetical protein [Tenacibaculum finnmarkense]MCG8237382.1 hypothetical protein [Tenacibaculum finnmarkense genomovar ulcerans]